jgi:hypothetical protein
VVSQLITAALYLASGIVLLIVGNRLTDWISRRDALRTQLDRHEKRLGRQEVKNERIFAAVHRMEDTWGIERTSFDIKDTD